MYFSAHVDMKSEVQALHKRTPLKESTHGTFLKNPIPLSARHFARGQNGQRAVQSQFAMEPHGRQSDDRAVGCPARWESGLFLRAVYLRFLHVDTGAAAASPPTRGNTLPLPRGKSHDFTRGTSRAHLGLSLGAERKASPPVPRRCFSRRARVSFPSNRPIKLKRVSRGR